MNWMRFSLILLTLSSLPGISTAGIFSRLRSDTNPAQRVQQHIQTVQTSKKAGERLRAVNELREYNAKAYPVIVPVLVQALRKDPSVSVRIAAARSLGRIRPLTKLAGSALNAAAQDDPTIRVRWQARTSLAVYTVAGFIPNNRVGPPKTKSNKTPQGNTKRPPVVTFSSEPKSKQKPGSRSGPGPLFLQPPPTGGPNIPRPLPSGPTEPPLPSTNSPTTTPPPPGDLVPLPVTPNEPPLAAPTPPTRIEPPIITPPSNPPQEGPILPPL